MVVELDGQLSARGVRVECDIELVGLGGVRIELAEGDAHAPRFALLAVHGESQQGQCNNFCQHSLRTYKLK